MIKSRMQLNTLIRNKAAGDGDKAQILLRIYMMERLLERISVSSYRDNFILKGGLLISSMFGVEGRTTMDMDTTVTGIDMKEDEIQRIITEILSIDVGDRIKFGFKKIEPIR